VLLRAMNSYYSNRIEGQHTLPIDIERALHNDYSNDAEQARRQRLALAHMETEAAIEMRRREWPEGHVWSARMVCEIHQGLFARLPIDRSEFKAMLGLGDRLATAQVSALLRRGLIASNSPHGKLRFGVPQHALRFYFPRLWPEAEAGPHS
jgi:Fic family protein